MLRTATQFRRYAATVAAVLAAAFALGLFSQPRPAHAQFANPSTFYVGWGTAPSTAANLATVLSPAPPQGPFLNGLFCYAAQTNVGTVWLAPTAAQAAANTGVPLTPTYVNVGSLGITAPGNVWVQGNGSDQIFCYGN